MYISLLVEQKVKNNSEITFSVDISSVNKQSNSLSVF